MLPRCWKEAFATGKVRFEFSKTGRAKYLSHLDTMRVLQRSFTRAGISVSYSEGFNPHMRLSILLPLPLGLESICELADIVMEHPPAESGFVKAMNASLPEGFEVTRLIHALRPAQDIRWAGYRLELTRAEGFNIGAELEAALDGRPLIIAKKTKRGIEDTDISPYVKDAVWEAGDAHTLYLSVKLSASSPSVNPSQLAQALCVAAPECAPDVVTGVRTGLFDAEFNNF